MLSNDGSTVELVAMVVDKVVGREDGGEREKGKGAAPPISIDEGYMYGT